MQVERVRHRPEEDEVEEKGILEWKGRERGEGKKKEVYYSSCRPITGLLECRILAPAARCDPFLLSWNINQRGPWVIGEF